MLNRKMALIVTTFLLSFSQIIPAQAAKPTLTVSCVADFSLSSNRTNIYVTDMPGGTASVQIVYRLYDWSTGLDSGNASIFFVGKQIAKTMVIPNWAVPETDVYFLSHTGKLLAQSYQFCGQKYY